MHIGICANTTPCPWSVTPRHNIIASAAAGAGLALARVADEVGLTVTVLGTPAERGWGQILMWSGEPSTGSTRAMMVHHFRPNCGRCVLAVSHFDVHITAKRLTPRPTRRGHQRGRRITISRLPSGCCASTSGPPTAIHGS